MRGDYILKVLTGTYSFSSVVFLLVPYIVLLNDHRVPSKNHMISISGLVSDTLPSVWFAVSGTLLFTSYRMTMVTYEMMIKKRRMVFLGWLFYYAMLTFLVFPITVNMHTDVTRKVHTVSLSIAFISWFLWILELSLISFTKLIPYLLIEAGLIAVSVSDLILKYSLKWNVTFLRLYFFAITESLCLLIPILVGLYLTKSLKPYLSMI